MMRATKVVLTIGACVLALAACSKPATVDTGSGAVGGSTGATSTGNTDLDATLGRITGDLTPDEKACINAANGAVTAADTCVTKARLGTQIADQVLAGPTFKNVTAADKAEFETCFGQVFAGLQAGDLGKLASQDATATAKVTDAMAKCQFSSGASTTSTRR